MDPKLPRPETCTVVGGDIGEGSDDIEISRIRPIKVGTMVRRIAKGYTHISYEALVAMCLSLLLDSERDLIAYPDKLKGSRYLDGRIRVRAEIRQIMELMEICYTRMKADEKDRRLDYYEKEITRIKGLLSDTQRSKKHNKSD